MRCTDIDLRSMYWNEGKTVREIAQSLGLHRETIREAMIRQGIRRRSKSEVMVKRWSGNDKRKWTKEDLYRLYWENQLSSLEIAKRYGVKPNTVITMMELLGVPRRSKSEANKLAYQKGKIRPSIEKIKEATSGERNWRWKGGRAKQGKYIMVMRPEHPEARRKYVYEHILVWEEVHNKRLPEGWVVHHLNGIHTDNRPENLVAMPSRKHIHLLAAKAKRIRELEAKVKLLEKALDSQQLIFNISEN